MLDDVKTYDIKRHHTVLSSKQPVRKDREGGPFGNAPIPEHKLPRRAVSVSALVEGRQDRLRRETEMLRAAPRLADAFSGTQDPRNLPNEFAHRSRWRDQGIQASEAAYADGARRLTEMRDNMGRISSLTAPPIEFDHRPTVEGVTAHRWEFYPRSLDAVKTFGGGKDPKHCRPIDKFSEFREIRFRLGDLLTSKK